MATTCQECPTGTKKCCCEKDPNAKGWKAACNKVGYHGSELLSIFLAAFIVDITIDSLYKGEEWWQQSLAANIPASFVALFVSISIHSWRERIGSEIHLGNNAFTWCLAKICLELVPTLLSLGVITAMDFGIDELRKNMDENIASGAEALATSASLAMIKCGSRSLIRYGLFKACYCLLPKNQDEFSSSRQENALIRI